MLAAAPVGLAIAAGSAAVTYWDMTIPTLQGIHHLKVHVTDARRSARWYQQVLGYEPVMEFYEQDQLVGYGMDHSRGGTLLTLRLDPGQAAKTAGWVYFEMGVPDRKHLDLLAQHLDAQRQPHGPVVETPIGWVLPGLFDPDGHEMRFYVSNQGKGQIDTQHPRRMHEAGTPSAWSEPLPAIHLGPSATDS